VSTEVPFTLIKQLKTTNKYSMMNQKDFYGEKIARFMTYAKGMFLLLLTAWFMISCSDSSTGVDPEPDPDLGTVEVEIVTTGGDESPPSVTAAIQGGESRSIDPNTTGSFINLSPGVYEVQISNIAAHCTMNSENPQTVEITGSETVRVNFEMNCIGILRNKIVYSSFEGGLVNIFKSDPDGSNREQLTDFGTDEYWKIAVSPDGTKILFVSEGDLGSSQIWVVDADGENLQNLTNDPQRFHEFPSWSPDGSQVAYHSYTNSSEGDIFIMNADGTGKTNITNTTSGEWWPDWSPDGNTIAFHVFRSNQPGIIETMNVDGTGRSVLFEDDEVSFNNPSWSPDGSQIAFRSNWVSEVSWEICVADADGSDIECLTNFAVRGIEHRFPTWSPDGNRLAFDSNRDGDANAYDVFVMSADGSGLRNLTSESGSPSFFPDWSPVVD